MSILTQQGMAALKAGNRVQARDLLQRAIQADNNDATAWLWLAGAVDTPAEREACLNEVLRIDPNHALALKALAQTRGAARGPAAGEITPSPAPKPPAPPVMDAPARQPEFSRESLFWPTDEPPKPDNSVGVLPGSAPAEPPPPVFSREALLGGLPEPPAPGNEPFVPAAQNPRPKPVRKPAPKARTRRKSILAPLLAVLGVLGLLTLTGFVFVYIIRQSAAASQPDAALVAAGESTPTLTPSPSPQPTQTLTPEPTLRPTQTPTPTETYVPIGPTARVQVERMQQEVANLRGLTVKSTAVGFQIVTRPQAEGLLKQRFVTEVLIEQMQDEQRVLTALGLTTPGYDLANNVINRVVDGIGGFYLPASDEIYVIGMRFGGIEHYVYAHEFDHALVKQNFDTATLKELACTTSSDACNAMNALLEGDASLLMRQWWKQYSGAQDYRDILLYRPSTLAFPEQYVPPFVVEDINFPYEKGLAFVEMLYSQGRWARVNKVYLSPPATSEQILHPKKYLSGEAAVPVSLPELRAALGDDWRQIKDDSLGEWSTYLMLAYQADESVQLNEVISTTASQGWGGDRYQVYHHAQTDGLAMAAQWAWDSQKDADEFAAALRQQLDVRYHALRPSFPGDCWGLEGDYSCVLIAPGQTLWLIAPTSETMENLRALFADFQ